MKIKKIVKTVKATESVKRGRGRPKGSKNITTDQSWYTFVCPTCGTKYGAITKNAEFMCNVQNRCGYAKLVD